MRNPVRVVLWLGSCVLTQLLCLQDAGAVVIRFAQNVDVVQNVTDPANALGAPDATYAGFTGPALEVPGDAVFSEFGGEVSYDTAALAALLGVSVALLEGADAITAEVNGQPSNTVPDDYETTTHTFDDGVGTRTVSHVYLGAAGPEIVARASISSAAYDAFFGVTSPIPGGGVLTYAFLLFDFDAAPGDAVDPLSPGFTWRVLGADLGAGSPDPDFFGVIAAAPEPGSFGLLLLAIAAARAARAGHSSRM